MFEHLRRRIAALECLLRDLVAGDACCPQGIYDSDEDAVADGLEEGDIYEYSETNERGILFRGLLKVVRDVPVTDDEPVVLGTNNMEFVLGTGSFNSSGDPIVLGIN